MRLAVAPVRFARAIGLGSLAKRIGLGSILPQAMQRMLDLLPADIASHPKLPHRLSPVGTRRAKVALLTGCAADVFFRHVHWATARVLQQNGCEVVVPQADNCCGAVYYHSGKEGPAVKCAIQTASLIDPDEVDAVIVNVAGCGAMIKEYGHLPVLSAYSAAVTKLASKVRDISQFLVELGPRKPTGELKLTATYHDACHLAHAQQIRSQPRSLLKLIPGLELVPLEESEICCGAAGTYNLSEIEMSDRLARRKADFIERTNAQALFVGNAGCSLHLSRELRRRKLPIWIAHPIEALDLSYRKMPPPNFGQVTRTTEPSIRTT